MSQKYPFSNGVDGRLQVMAGVSLVEYSHLMKWDTSAKLFESMQQPEFMEHWEDVDPIFGRLICWISFSAGAEFLLKGVCLLNDVNIRKEELQKIPMNPTEPLNVWASQYCSDLKSGWKSGGIDEVPRYYELGTLFPRLSYEAAKPPAWVRLCDKVLATPDQRNRLFAAYDLLRSRIRNRDAHAFVPNVRDSSFWLVSGLFTDCFNDLVSWLPGGSGILNLWRDSEEVKKFIAVLPPL